MQQAVLLRQPFVERAPDGHCSGLDRFEAGAERSHQTLSVEAPANTFHGRTRISHAARVAICDWNSGGSTSQSRTPPFRESRRGRHRLNHRARSGGPAPRRACHTGSTLISLRTARSRRDNASPSAERDAYQISAIVDRAGRDMARRQLCRTPPSALRETDSETRRDCCATSRRFRESVRQLQVWFGQGGSPAAAQFVENLGGRSKTARLRGLPRRRESLVQRAALLVCEVVALVVCEPRRTSRYRRRRR